MSPPSMAEYVEKIRQEMKAKLDAMSAEERRAYLNKVTVQGRAAASVSNVPFTEDFLMGCLFATSALSVGVVMVHRAGIMDHETMEQVTKLAKEQEFVCYGIVRGTP